METPNAPVLLHHFLIQTVIGSGGSGIVFLGENQRLAELGVSLKIALKLVWSKTIAQEEAQRLSSLQDVQGIVVLEDGFPVTSADFEKLLPLIENYERRGFKTKKTRLSAPSNKENFMLVMEYLKIGRLLHFEGMPHFQSEGYRYRTNAGDWSLDERLQKMTWPERVIILLQLANRIKTVHSKGLVHGDLNPFNLVYNFENKSITLIDFGFNETNFGMDGWRTPDHVALYRGELGAIGAASDIYSLGLWISVLLEENTRSLTGLVRQCCAAEGENRPSIDAVIGILEKCLRRPKMRRLAIFAASMTLAVLGGMVSYHYFVYRAPFQAQYLDDNGNEILYLKPRYDYVHFHEFHNRRFANLQELLDRHMDVMRLKLEGNAVAHLAQTPYDTHILPMHASDAQETITRILENAGFTAQWRKDRLTVTR